MMKEVEATVNPDAAIKQLRSRVALRQPLLGSGAHGGVDVGKGNRGRCVTVMVADAVNRVG